MWTAKPIQPAIMAPPMNCPVAPMLNRPARKASATARPDRMRGVAFTAVSDSGLKIAAIEPPWKAAEIVCGLKMAPSSIAEKAEAATAQAVEKAAPGAENRWLQACSTVGLENAMSSPPMMMAVTIARNVTTAELPSSTALRREVATFA